MVDFYNCETKRFTEAKKKNTNLKINDFINTDATKISWSSSLIPKLGKGEEAIFEKDKINIALYRPYFKQIYIVVIK